MKSGPGDGKWKGGIKKLEIESEVFQASRRYSTQILNVWWRRWENMCYVGDYNDDVKLTPASLLPAYHITLIAINK